VSLNRTNLKKGSKIFYNSIIEVKRINVRPSALIRIVTNPILPRKLTSRKIKAIFHKASKILEKNNRNRKAS
jgi:hypothetical protein